MKSIMKHHKYLYEERYNWLLAFSRYIYFCRCIHTEIENAEFEEFSSNFLKSYLKKP